MTEKDEPSRRDRILEAAVFEFGNSGFGGATWRSIADRAGVNQALIKFYFEDKDGLWRAALAHAQREKEANLPVLGEKVTHEDVAVWVAAYVRDAAAHPSYARMMIQEATGRSDRLNWAAEKVLRQAHKDFFAGVEYLQEHGWFPGMSPLSLLYALVGAANYPFMVAAEVEAVAKVNPVTPAWIEEHAKTVAWLFARRDRPTLD